MRALRIGFIATRLAGTDGVSLETRKWDAIFRQQGHRCFYLAGELDHEPERAMLVAQAHFKHPAIKRLQETCFGVHLRPRAVTQEIYALKELLKDALYAFRDKFALDLLVPENVLAIPLNLPLGLALTEMIAETQMPAIAHHHDLFWERQRFLTNAVWDYLNMAFPPHLPSIRHVVINSSARHQLSLRTGIAATLIPNLMDFDHPPAPVKSSRAGLRQRLGIAEDELFILQPTRVVPRKGIEHAIELVSRLGLKAKLVISHAAGDEGYEYVARLREYAQALQVEVLFLDEGLAAEQSAGSQGAKVDSLAELYPHADLVTYPSTFEGFGNALLEAIYFRKPVVINNYAIYAYDIKPKGFRLIEFNGYITSQTIAAIRTLLSDAQRREEMVEHNYQLARRHYSYAVGHHKLKMLLHECFG